MAIRETAEIYKSINEVAAEKIKQDTYVDDITTGADTKEEVDSLEKGITEILDHAGLEVHGFVRSGDNSEETLSLLGCGRISRVLGVGWNPTTDEYSVSVTINISKKYRGARTGSDYSYDEIPQLITIVLTRRIIQGIVYSCYDIYGLVCPITIQLKIELRNLFSKELNLLWDDPIPEELKKKWIQVLQLMKSVEHIKFRRCIKPDAPVIGNPILIVCNDASAEAMCTTAHVRWTLQDGTFACYLYAAKTRVAPLQKETIPRLEMQSAVMAVRLRQTITTHSQLEFSEIVHILDSKCTLATFHKDTVGLKEFMGNRASEVHQKSNLEEWSHIDTKKNISDLGTRKNARAEDISEESDWQRGTTWMRSPRTEWSVSQDISGVIIPSEELANKSYLNLACTTDSIIKIYDLKRFKGRSYDFVLNVTARVISACHSKSFKGVFTDLLARNVIEAEKFCIETSMFYTKQELDAGRLKSLRPRIDEDGVIVVNSRADEETKSHYGTDRFPILAYNDPLSFIWMQHTHNEDHSGITKTVAKSRRKFWIVRGRKLATKVKRSCYECRRMDKELAEQQMAPLPDSRLKVAPTFHITSMDLCGPYEIRDTVKQRTKKKVWIVIFNCTVVRAVYIDLTEDYSTDSILQTLRRFVSIRGCPEEIQSDQRSQLIAVANDIAQLVEKWDWKPIHEWASCNKIKWTLAPPEGQHQNGLSESLVKLTKRSLENKIRGHALTFSQLQMVLFEIANIMNSRPLGVISGSDPECPSPITPNDLILGRASSEVPQGPFDLTNSPKNITKKFRFLQDLVTQWWESWYQTVFPSLVPCYKWLQRHRNVEVGDVCLIRYKKEIRATYRLGRVHEVKKGADGLVRTVALKYKLPNEKVYRTVDRPIHGICVIVPIEEQGCDSDIDKTPHVLNPSAPDFMPTTA